MKILVLAGFYTFVPLWILSSLQPLIISGNPLYVLTAVWIIVFCVFGFWALTRYIIRNVINDEGSD